MDILRAEEKLSKNFKRKELACKCCGQSPVDSKLVEGLQMLRDILGIPITLTCAYRCPKHNKEVGGEPESRHMTGQAADIACTSITPKEMYYAALKVPQFAAGGIGIYPENGFIHVDVGPRTARWAKLKGRKVKYFDKATGDVK